MGVLLCAFPPDSVEATMRKECIKTAYLCHMERQKCIVTMGERLLYAFFMEYAVSYRTNFNL